jgi:oligopeptide/dipeptide ABC transporter ATP-binding protein
MYLGKIVEIGPPTVLYAGPGHPYTRALLSAVPVPDPLTERRRKRVILRGDVPSPVNPPSGCRFHTRCWLYERLGKPENCREEDPPLRVLSGDHRAACHYAEDALQTDVGVAHVGESTVRRGTPEAALKVAHKAEADHLDAPLSAGEADLGPVDHSPEGLVVPLVEEPAESASDQPDTPDSPTESKPSS